MLQDIKLLKQLNFNAVRNAHYTNHMRWGARMGDAAYGWTINCLLFSIQVDTFAVCY